MKTDADLKQEVRAALQSEPGLEAGGLNVTVVDGIVTLAGSVPVCAQKFRAEAVAKAVRGVRAVVDDIGVCRPDGGRPSDADIAAAVLHAIKWDTDVPEDLIRVIVRDGWITLEGTVDSAFQREAADRVVRRMIGAQGLTNSILVRPPAPTATARPRSEAAPGASTAEKPLNLKS
jgi:osmotically-inducible protein OsmY